ncbi:MAG TPA: molybdopterin-dependent oxidoreductase, partial [Burkholderiales bacterium]|nr:molybdopterin-dependent oxidoreductase [Burkholderiales bacterium]
IHLLHSVDDDWLMPIASRRIVAPSAIPAQISSFKEILSQGRNAAVLIGAWAEQHPQAAQIHAAAQALGVKVGFIGEAASSVGGYLAGLPVGGNVHEVLGKSALVVLGAEPELDCADPQAALARLRAAEFVVQLSPWRTGLEYAHVVLPITPFSEGAGTFVSIEGRAQSFHAAVNPLGEARPAWKVLRVLGSLLGREDMRFDTLDEVRGACLRRLDIAKLLSNGISSVPGSSVQMPGIERIADVPAYFADPLVRRSPPLQKTREARAPRAWMNARLLERLGVAAGQPVLVKSGAGEAKLMAALDERLPDDCVRVSAAHPASAPLGPMFGGVTLEKAAVQQAA